MPLKVIIVGAGIAGLATAVGLARHGHQVIVYERRLPSSREQSGSGIQLQPNINTILETWGLMSELKKVAHDNELCDMRRADGSSIIKFDYRPKGPAHYILRRVCKDLFRDFALRVGVQIHEGVKVEHLDVDSPAIILEDGRRDEADLIVGADGSGSKIRRLLSPLYEPAILSQICWQVVLPLSKVQSDPVLRTVLDEHHNLVYVSPGRNVFISPAPFQNQVDLQFADHEYTLEQDPNPGQANEPIYDLTWLRQRFSDYDPGTRRALELATSAFKWRFTEVVDGLPSWSSESRKVVLLGDSAHAMPPWSGQGTALGIEDAAVLSELLAGLESGDDLRTRIQMYEQIRRPRCEKMRKYSRIVGRSWAEKDPEKIAMRDQQWRASMNHPRYATAKPDMNSSYGSPEFRQYLDRYNVFEAVRAELENGPDSRARL